MYHFEPALAGAIVGGAMATFVAIGMVAPRSIALVVGQLVLLALPVIVAIASRRGDWRRTIGLTAPRATDVLAAILVGTSAWYVNLTIVSLLPIEPPPALRAVVEQPSLLETLVTLAVIPPICEEVLFRGTLTRGLANGATRGIPVIVAVAGSAVVFSFYHLSLVQALPTLTLGLALGWLALRARSIVPGMVVHALNNAIAIVISRDELPGLTGWFRTNGHVALAASLTLLAVGLAIATFGRPVA